MSEYRAWPDPAAAIPAEVTVARMKELEYLADEAGLTYYQMMENAGRAAARILRERWPGAKTAAVWCGKGNNGGDGFVVARMLAKAGLQVLVVLAEGEPGTWDAMANYRLVKKMGLPMVDLSGSGFDPESLEFMRLAELSVDAVCGTAVKGVLRGGAAEAMGWRHHGRGARVALDLPSGIEADTGAVGCSVSRAELTVAFHAPKACHRLAADRCGEVVVADIGITAALGL
ncbi:MAG: NAD(P)H-hydrate epimerase [Oscillospiraceae bacterium]|nr:NAD(P)H-hydrate epimerase [Oscillospiraceae bacterium]